jgi:hypothetical protein
MTVKELMEMLKYTNPDSLVLIPGYEGGYRTLSEVRPVLAELNVNSEWYYGPHELDGTEPAVLLYPENSDVY